MSSFSNDRVPLELKYLTVERSSSSRLLGSEISSRRQVWIPHETEGFVRAFVIDDDDDDPSPDNLLLLELENTGQRVRLSADECQKANPAAFYKAENMADLTCLNDASVLHNLRERYLSGLIYTYSGLFCVVVNPYKRLPIYSEALMAYYRGKRPSDVPPHVFAVTDAAYRSMLYERSDQSILCTGESGAGKTENTKKVIAYLAFVASARGRVSSSGVGGGACDLEHQLLKANPILEAFGNAKTVKNDNSSRFGKFIRVSFDPSGFISGASIETYLLEKSRTVRQAANERNFHIFYQLIRGGGGWSDKPPADLLLLESCDAYAYLSNSAASADDDAAQFADTCSALRAIVDAAELHGILATLSAVLLLGNIVFVSSDDGQQALMPDDTVAQKVCRLLGLGVIDFSRALLHPRVKCGREVVSRATDLRQVESAVEAVAKASYDALFKWVVLRINRALGRSSALAQRLDDDAACCFIGILDIAGFEIFAFNSFEQLCINYTNERLQQLFNHTMFELEQREYAREYIEWKFMDFGLDLQPTIDLIDKHMGILSLLDEECVFPNSTELTFVAKLTAAQGSHANFVVRPAVRARHDFSVRHYAGTVHYCADQWILKNTDPINDNVVHLLQTSALPFVREVWRGGDGGGAAKKGMFRTVAQMYKEQLTALMAVLNHTTPNFVRCIIPNATKSAGRMEPRLVLAQLRCNGVLEGIRICRHGFPNRIPFQEFRRRYEVLASSASSASSFTDGRLACERLFADLELDSNLFRIGATKIFFRAGVLAHLEDERDQKISESVAHLQSLCRGALARRAFARRTRHTSAVRIVQRNGRVLLRVCDWRWFRLFTRIKPLLSVTRLDEALAARERELAARERELARAAEERAGLVVRVGALVDELSQERELVRELTDSRARLLARKAELEGCVEELEAEEGARASDWGEERAALEAAAKDARDRLSEEERRRQRLEVDWVVVEGRLRAAEAEAEEARGAVLRRERELAAAHLDERAAAERAARELRARVVDLEDELRGEREARAKTDADRRDLAEENEALRNEVSGASEDRRRGEEVGELRRQVADERQRRFEALQAAKARFGDQLRAVSDEAEKTRADLLAVAKEKAGLEARLVERDEELVKALAALRTAEADLRRGRAAEAELDALNELYADKVDEAARLEAKAQSLTAALSDARSAHDQQLDEQRRAVQRERGRADDVTAQLEHAVSARAKLQNELADLAAELDRFRGLCSAFEKSQRHVDRRMGEERALQEKLRAELDAAERDNREKETRLLSLQYDLRDRDESVKLGEVRVKQLKSELDDALSRKDDVGRSVCGLERSKRALEDAAAELQARVVELEDELGNAESARLRADVNLSAMKQQLERQVAEANEASDERYRSAVKQLRALEGELDDERRAKAALLSQQKSLDVEVADAQQRIAEAVRAKEELSRQTKRMSAMTKELTRELEEAVTARDECAKEWERRHAAIEQVLGQAEQDRETAERARKSAVAELDELKQELDAAREAGPGGENRRRLEARISELEDDLSEESAQAGILSEKLRKALQANEAVVAELNQERINAAKIEMNREGTERANRELKQRLVDADESFKTRNKLTMSSIENKLNSVEQQLEVEQKERQRLARSLRCTEKKFRELGVKFEEERSAHLSAKEHADNATNRVRQLKKEMDQLEESVSATNARCRKLQREKEELEGVVVLKEHKLRQIEARSSVSFSRTLRNFGDAQLNSEMDAAAYEADEDDALSVATTGSGISSQRYGTTGSSFSRIALYSSALLRDRSPMPSGGSKHSGSTGQSGDAPAEQKPPSS